MSGRMYKLFQTGLSLGSGMLAGALFKKLWKAAPVGGDTAPAPTDEERRLREILLAAAVQGAVTGLVRAATSRGGAVGVRRATGSWPA
ncbi:DUF4235 domain-containing protein [Streptomyces oceani]|nr:DUF4235 domain-containing protein [Streptomyces oceani]